MTTEDIGASEKETREHIALKLASAINTFTIETNGQLGTLSAVALDESIHIYKGEPNSRITVIASAVNGTGNHDNTQSISTYEWQSQHFNELRKIAAIKSDRAMGGLANL